MPYLFVRHKVFDYPKWKSVFDGHSTNRKAAGLKKGTLFRVADDPEHVMMLLEVESLDRARQFILSEDLRSTMEESGVADRPDVYFLEEVEKVS